MAGAAVPSKLDTPWAFRAEEAPIIAQLKAGSEDAYAWLIAKYHQPIYNLVCSLVHDPSDAADTTQEVFLKVYRGILGFQGESSLKTWMYRIAVREASNQRRWWFRHKSREGSVDTTARATAPQNHPVEPRDILVDQGTSPFENTMRRELRAWVAQGLSQIPEPYRTTVILRDLQELSYTEIAEVMETSLGTVKSRLTRGREALKELLVPSIENTTQHYGRVRTWQPLCET